MLWWLSFALDDDVTCKVCIVEADSFMGARMRATRLGLNPGGQLLGFPIPSGGPEENLPHDRFLTEEELRAVEAKKLYEIEGN